MRTRSLLAGLVLIVGLGTLAACGGTSGSAGTPAPGATGDVKSAGDIPDSQVFVAYKAPTGVYSLTVPEGWTRKELANGAEFSDKFNTVKVEQTTVPNAPTVNSVRTSEVGLLRQSNPSFVLGDVTTVSRKAGDAIKVAYTLDGTPDATSGKAITLAVERYEFWKAGTLVTITVSGAKSADNIDPWRVVTDSFGWVG